MTTHEERVRQSFSKQAYMSTLGGRAHSGGSRQCGDTPAIFAKSYATERLPARGCYHCGAGFCLRLCCLTLAADDKEVLTVELKVNLLSPAAGEVFAARAQVKKPGRTLTVCTADVFAISGGKEKVVATMLATIMAVPITPAK